MLLLLYLNEAHSLQLHIKEFNQLRKEITNLENKLEAVKRLMEESLKNINYKLYIRKNYSTNSNKGGFWFVRATIYDYQMIELDQKELQKIADQVNHNITDRPNKIINLKLGPKEAFHKGSNELEEAARNAITNYVFNKIIK